MNTKKHRRRNTSAFVFLSYFTLVAGVSLFGIGLYNETSLELNEKGYYIAVMLLCIVGAILTQKVVRDNADDDAIIEEQAHEERLKHGVGIRKTDND